MQFPQLVPTVQWPELAACSFSWCYEKQFQMRARLRGGLNTLHIPQLVQLFSGLKLAARSLQPVLWKQKMFADASRGWPERTAQ